ncbi:hypothetical protein TPA0906_44790 [Streptomyces olivaceus]|uniref:hypothetical protein n=1 Tax=Streptomyces olivaceus TaxID=47716 RepID=UPI0022EF7C95|nr:hypothetical protein [Streptomyces olivaceus]GHJ02614.1 hypothetical protein TPA0906_44790 [Streptomyces olivaceus]
MSVVLHPLIDHETWTGQGRTGADQVRATVAAAAPATGYEVRRLLYAVGRLAVWADSGGLPRDPGLWLRTEKIDAFVLSGCPGLEGSTVRTCRTWLRLTREALVWAERGAAPPVRIASPRSQQPPYEKGELARLRDGAGHLPGRARLDGLALMRSAPAAISHLVNSAKSAGITSTPPAGFRAG